MRRILLGLLGLCVLVGIITSAAESTGMLGRTCGCQSDCWCKKPGMNTFRWAWAGGSASSPRMGLVETIREKWGIE